MCPSVPLNRQDLNVGLMTTFGSRTGGTAQSAAEQLETIGQPLWRLGGDNIGSSSVREPVSAVR